MVTEDVSQHPARWLRPPTLRTDEAAERRATWLELFFDLCFVVAVGAVAGELHGDPTGGGLLRFAGLFIVVWWAWMGYTWYATAFDTDDVVYRLALLAAMLAVLALAANVDRAVAGEPAGFILAYVALKALLVGLFLRARRHVPASARFAAVYAAGFALATAVWLASLLVDDAVRLVVWTPAIWMVAMLVELATPAVAVRFLPGRAYNLSHIPERYGLFTIVVLGEAVIAVARGTADSPWALDSTLTAVAGFVIAAAIWWISFEHVDTTLLGRGRVAAFAWGYGHLLVFAGIAATGVGIELAIEGQLVGHPLSGGERAVLGGGLATYFLTMALLRGALVGDPRDRLLQGRVVAAGLAGLFGLIGGIPAGTTTALLATVAVAAAHHESTRTPRQGELTPPPHS